MPNQTLLESAGVGKKIALWVIRPIDSGVNASIDQQDRVYPTISLMALTVLTLLIVLPG